MERKTTEKGTSSEANINDIFDALQKLDLIDSLPKFFVRYLISNSCGHCMYTICYLQKMGKFAMWATGGSGNCVKLAADKVALSG